MNVTDDLVARFRVFVLLDGSFVVQWDDDTVQDLLTGAYRPFDRQDVGAAITDFELGQLKQVGIVSAFDDERVQLLPASERSRFYQRSRQRKRVRTYYLNTTLGAGHLSMVAAGLMRLGVDHEFEARLQDDFVVLWRKDGSGFHDFDSAEEVRVFLIEQAEAVFSGAVVAFIETTHRE